jgi:hypothetical protein
LEPAALKDPIPGKTVVNAAIKQTQLFVIPSKPLGKGTPVAGKAASARSAK